MSEPSWTGEVRQEEWSLEMIFQWLEESAAFLYQIETRRRGEELSHCDPSGREEIDSSGH